MCKLILPIDKNMGIYTINHILHLDSVSWCFAKVQGVSRTRILWAAEESCSLLRERLGDSAVWWMAVKMRFVTRHQRLLLAKLQWFKKVHRSCKKKNPWTHIHLAAGTELHLRLMSSNVVHHWNKWHLDVGLLPPCVPFPLSLVSLHVASKALRKLQVSHPPSSS